MGWIDEFVQPGWICVDVGANHGSITSQLLQQVGPTGAVYAIDPQPELVTELRTRTPYVLTLAVGDHDGAEVLHYSQQAEHASLYRKNVLEDIDKRRTVLMRTLDSLQATGEIPAHIDAIKVDVQGAEVAILRGAAQMIATQKPIWYVELWALGLDQAGESVEALCALGESYGYRVEGMTWTQAADTCRRQGGHGSIDILMRPKD